MNSVRVFINIDGNDVLAGLLYTQAAGRKESSTFVYNQSWLDWDKAFPASPDMPLASSPYHFGGERNALPGIIRDSAPDRWGRKLIARAATKARDTAPIHEIDYLLRLDDFTRIGALRFADDRGFFYTHHFQRNVPPILRLPELLRAVDAVQKDGENAEDLRLLLGVGSPLGGARPKSAVMDDDGFLAIAKFPSASDDRNIAAGEVLCSYLAASAGISVSPTRLIRVADKPVSIIRRFDRVDGGGRVHFASALTLLGAKDGDDGTYEDIAFAIRTYSEHPANGVRELFRRATFNVLASNFDDHLRNHGFLHAGGEKWNLSPAYDMNPIPAHEHAGEMATGISAESGKTASVDALLAGAERFGLRQDEAKSIIRQIADAISRWRSVARQVGVTEAELAPYETAFEHVEMTKALSL